MATTKSTDASASADAAGPAPETGDEPAPQHVDYIAQQQRRERLRAKLQQTHRGHRP